MGGRVRKTGVFWWLCVQIPRISHHSHQSSQISRPSKFLQSLSAVKVSNFSATKTLTPVKINMEHNRRGLEDHVPLQMGDL